MLLFIIPGENAVIVTEGMSGLDSALNLFNMKLTKIQKNLKKTHTPEKSEYGNINSYCRIFIRARLCVFRAFLRDWLYFSKNAG